MATGRVLIAFDDAWSEEEPTWTRIDEQTGFSVSNIQIDRGRAQEFDKTDTGTATIQLVDYSGAFDPTNSGSTYGSKTDPMRQVLIQRKHPISGTWYPRFRGFISKWTFEPYPKENVMFITIECEDGLAVLAAAELMAGQHGDTPPTISDGNVWYGPTTGTIVQAQIGKILDDAGWPTGLRSIFSGNVHVQPTVYSSRNQFLTAIDDMADAEFPGVANRWIGAAKPDGTPGCFVFHGRLARFHPSDVSYNIDTYKAGDDAAVLSDPTTIPLAGGSEDQPLQFVHDKNDIINQAYFAPKGILQSDIANQWVTPADAGASIDQFGPRTLSGEDLITLDDLLTGDDAKDATKSFGQYFVDAYSDTKTRVPQLSFATRDTGALHSSALWDFLTKSDIGDRIQLTTTHGHGGGFSSSGTADYFYIEGFHETQTPMNTRTDDVRVTVDVSPATFWGSAFDQWES